MKKIILKILFVLDIAAIVLFVIFSQFLIKYNTITGVTTDGFGRKLSKAPLFLQSTGLIDYWAGWFWFLIDSVLVLILFAVAYILFTKITNRNKR